jgi:hypothetical protein
MVEKSQIKKNPKRRHGPVDKVKVPVGVEKILYHAADNDEFKRLLLEDREAAITSTNVRLRESEEAVLKSVSDDALDAMIDRIVARNPRRRRFMGLVAAAAASLAAGTAVIGCDVGCDEVETKYDYADSGGAAPDIDTDTDTDTETETDTDTDTDPDAGTDAGNDAGDN